MRPASGGPTGRKGPSRVRASLSLFPTPLLVVSSAHELYIRNESQFDRRWEVLLPLWAGAAAVVLLGALLRHGATRAPAALWAYHLGGVFFVLYVVLRNSEWNDRVLRWVLDAPTGFGLLVLLWALAAWAASRLATPESAVPALALIGAVLLAGEAIRFASRERPPGTTSAASPSDDALRPRTTNANIYHVILDSYQANTFAAAAAAVPDSAFDGFVLFENARGRETATEGAVATVLLSRWLDHGESRHLAFAGALASPTSLVAILRRGGYATTAYVPPDLYPLPSSAFDRFVPAPEPDVGVDMLHGSLFWRLWLFSLAPSFLAEALAEADVVDFDGADLAALRTRRLSTYVQPIRARLAFLRALRDEPDLPAAGRYTWIHVLLPHDPYVLDDNCATRPLHSPSSAEAQTACATRLVAELTTLLKSLGRFDGATIVIHGDHGLTAFGEQSRFRLAPLLMVKAPHARGPLRVSPSAAALIDIGPTVLAAAGLPVPAHFEGNVLGDAVAAPTRFGGESGVRIGSGAR